MFQTVRSLRSTTQSTNANQYRTDDAPGIYSEQSQNYPSPSPTPSWRKPDPSQWRYGANFKK